MKKLYLATALIILISAGCNKGGKPTRDTQVPLNEQTNQTPQQTNYKIALVLTGDNGTHGKKVGCEDSVVLVSRSGQFTTQPLNAAFKDLFSLGSVTIPESQSSDQKPQTKQNYYNAIFKMQENTSNKLVFDHATIQNGIAKIFLTGEMSGLGGVCDAPRVQAQINETALQFPSVTSVETYLNNTPIDWQTFNSQK